MTTELTNAAIETIDKPEVNIREPERILSIAGGLTVLLCALDRRPASALVGILVGGGLLYRGITGHCHLYASLNRMAFDPDMPTDGVAAQRGERVEAAAIVEAPTKQVYEYWRQLRHLSTILTHVSSVAELSATRSRWQVETPFGTPLSWEAEIINDKPGELIAWKSLPGGTLSTAGSVQFAPLQDGQATRVSLNLKYDPPGGKLAIWAAKVLGAELSDQLNEDLKKFGTLIAEDKTLAVNAPKKKQ